MWILLVVYSGFAVGAFIVGILQMIVLLATTTRALWWVLASTMGGIFMSGRVMGGFMCYDDPITLNSVLHASRSGIAYGAVTGLFLVWLLKERTTRSTADAPDMTN
jgi:hypothetical protein